MSEQFWTLATIIVYFLVMLAIGVWSYNRTSDVDDYVLGGRKLNPFTAALSAGASDMSGWLLMGLPGAIFLAGLVDAWIAIGLTIGAWLNWKFVAPRLRSYTERAGNAITVPRFFENRLHDSSHRLRLVSGLVILVFFTFYVSSGMVAGGKFFQSSFGTDYYTGLLVVSGVVVAYTLIGGFLAVCYTDMVQGLMMVTALIAVPVAAVVAVGGIGPALSLIEQADASHGESHLSLIAGASVIGVISAMAWGLGYVGQPHIIVRFMALRNPRDARLGRRVGITWMILSVLGAIATALAGVAYVQYSGLALTDPERAETVFLDLGKALFHPIIAGFMLAAVLAAVMSTISSQLLVTSSALVEDIALVVARRKLSESAGVWISRAAVLLVSVVAAVMAIDPAAAILDLVGFAWAGFGAAFGPIVVLSLWWRRLTANGALAGMIAGAVTVGFWAKVPLLASTGLYEIVPGFLVNLVVAGLVSRLGSPAPGVAEEFEDAALAAR